MMTPHTALTLTSIIHALCHGTFLLSLKGKTKINCQIKTTALTEIIIIMIMIMIITMITMKITTTTRRRQRFQTNKQTKKTTTKNEGSVHHKHNNNNNKTLSLRNWPEISAVESFSMPKGTCTRLEKPDEMPSSTLGALALLQRAISPVLERFFIVLDIYQRHANQDLETVRRR